MSCFFFSMSASKDVSTRLIGQGWNILRILVEPTELLFTAQTWAQPQAVTVIAVDDQVDEPVEFASIWHNSTSLDPNYQIGSERIQRVNVTVISDD